MCRGSKASVYCFALHIQLNFDKCMLSENFIRLLSENFIRLLRLILMCRVEARKLGFIVLLYIYSLTSINVCSRSIEYFIHLLRLLLIC